MSIENPPAFPQSLAPDGPFGGMTLRDYFAGQALAGYFAAPYTPHMNADHARTAKYCFAMADAMLVARQKGPTDE